MAKRGKTSEQLKREQEVLRQKIREDTAREKELAARIKLVEKEEREERYIAAGAAFEAACAKAKLKVEFNAEVAAQLARFAAENGFEVKPDD